MSVEEFYDCYQNRTKNGFSMVSHTRKFNFQTYSFENTFFSTWKIFSTFFYGNCVTSNDVDDLKDQQFFKIYLNKSMDFLIWIHDPDFFYISINPRSIPKLRIDFSPVMKSQTRILYYLGKEKHKKLQRKKVLWVHKKLGKDFLFIAGTM